MNVFSNPIAQLNKTEPIEIDNKQNQVEYGDVFFTTSSETPDEVGMSSVWLENKGNIYLNSFCFGFRPFVKNDPYYMAYMLRANRFRKSMTLLAQGISRYNISKIGVMNIDIQLPNNQEQERIGKLFSEIDNLITLHQRKSLINLHSWEQRKLGDVSFFKQGSQVDLDKQYSDLNENRVRFIRIVDYTQNTDDIRYIDKELSNNIINEKDVVIVRYGATAGFVGHGITGVLANNMFTVNPENDVAKDYLYIYLKQDKIYKKLNNSNGSSAMPALNFGTVKDVEIAYPLVAEQDKIGELFKNLDNLITLHQRKKNKEGNG